MPLPRLCRLRDRMMRLFLMSHDLNPFDCVTNHTSQNPVRGAHEEKKHLLFARETPKQDVENRNSAKNYAQPEPPENPMVNTQVNMHEGLLII